MTAVVTLDKMIDQDITVPFTVTGTATLGVGNDYTLTGSPIVISAGSLTGFIVISIELDSLDEHDETVELTLGAPTNAELHVTDFLHTATILDNDPTPHIYFNPDTQFAPENIGSITTTLELDAISGLDISVEFSASGTATENVDYTISTYTVNIPAGSASADISIEIADDLPTGEMDETAILNFISAVNAISAGNYSLTITEIATEPTVAFSQAIQNVSEGAGKAIVRVDLSNAWGLDVEVGFSLSGTAGGADYSIDTSSPLYFPVGSTSAEITVSVSEDLFDEDDETLVFALGSVSNATLDTPDVHTLTIIDNDEPPEVSFSPTALEDDENNIGTTIVRAQLDKASEKAVTVPFTVSGSATQGAGNDFTMTASPLTIPAGSTSADISITVNGEATKEYDEDIVITMGSPTNATAAASPNNEHSLTIRDDDACRFVVSEPSLAGDTLTWQITNNAKFMIMLTSLALDWDVFGGESLESIELNDIVIVSQKDTANPTIIPSGLDGDFVGPSSNRQIAPGGTAKLEFIFKKNVSSGYPIELVFDNDPTWCLVDDTY
jgi:hypothetical protein